VPESQLDAIGLGLESSGLMLGRDSAAAPVRVRIFGPQPLRVAFVGDWWAARILVGRCLALGVVVQVDGLELSPRHGLVAPVSQWLLLDRLAGGTSARVRLDADAGAAAGSSAAPVLRLHDVGPGGPPGHLDLGPWQTQLIMLSRVTEASRRTLSTVDLVLAQRLAPQDAGLVGSALLLSREFVGRLSALEDGMVAAVRGLAVRYLWLHPTPTERQLFG
jgi:hypothetical protein